MSIFSKDRELSYNLVDYLKNNEEKEHQHIDNASKFALFGRYMLLMNHRLLPFALLSGLSSGAGLHPGESTENEI